jgi:hypothetical protein
VSPPGGPAITALTNAGPNPGHGPLFLSFDLATPEPVEFDLLDIEGRVVATRSVEQLDRGSWSRTWDPFAGSGGAAGVYFLRMRIGSQNVGERRIVRLG